MVKLDNFNAADHENQTSTCLPAGKYKCIIEDTVKKDTRDGLSWYVEVTYKVIEGDGNGRKIWQKLNIGNKSDKAAKIANGQLADICKALDIMQPASTEELHGRPLFVKVKVEEYNDRKQNAVTSVSPLKPKVSTVSTADAEAYTEKIKSEKPDASETEAQADDWF